MIEKSLLQVYIDLHPRLSPNCTTRGHTSSSVEGPRGGAGLQVHKARMHSHRLGASSLGGATAHVLGEPASLPSCTLRKNSDFKSEPRRNGNAVPDPGPQPRKCDFAQGNGGLSREDCSRRPRQVTPTDKRPLHLGVRPAVSTIHGMSSRVRIPSPDFRAKGLSGLLPQSWHQSQSP